MPRIFAEQIKERFPESEYLSMLEGVEFFQITKYGPHKGKSFEEIREIAKRYIRGLDYEVLKAKSSGTGIGKDSPMIVFDRSGHFISFMLETENELSVIMNLGWRGRIPLTEEERAIYLRILKDYFKSNKQT